MTESKTVGVVILGDIGRSPRIQYHSYSLRREGYKVKIIGYNESKYFSSLLGDIEIVHVEQPPVLACPTVMHFIFKVLWSSFFLLYALLRNGRFHVLLVQNPPAIPTLFICWIYCKLSGGKMIIDWHNYAYSILSLSVGQNHILVRISKLFEKYCGQLAHHNFCVTRAMKKDLKNKWNIESILLYDRPGPSFIPSISHNGKLKFFKKLATIYSDFTLLESEKRVGLLISSTSWTEDEDFSILFKALIDYDTCDIKGLPFLLCVITGKGPLKEFYCKQIETCEWTRVKIITPWLEPEDYPLLLASADLGVCLHTSSSGLDLPMKVIDMFGSSLPVCAYEYPCLSELVQNDVNGLVFSNYEQLASHLKSWFKYFPEIDDRSIRFRRNISEFQKLDWHQNWKDNALPLFLN